MPRTRALKREKAAPIAAVPENGSNGQAPEKKQPVYLASLYQNDTVIIEVDDPSEEEFVDTGIRIEVASRYSDDAIQAMEDHRERVRAAKAAGEEEPPVDEAVLETLNVVTKRWWHDGETTDGIYLTPDELLTCTSENKRKVFSDKGYRWLRNVVLARCWKQKDFFGKRPKTA